MHQGFDLVAVLTTRAMSLFTCLLVCSNCILHRERCKGVLGDLGKQEANKDRVGFLTKFRNLHAWPVWVALGVVDELKQLLDEGSGRRRKPKVCFQMSTNMVAHPGLPSNAG